MTIQQKIKETTESIFNELVEIRRHLHANPELSFQEFETSKFIVAKLKQHGIAYQDGIVQTGIVATVKGKNPEKGTVVLRGDMDALPISEKNEVDYKSKNVGVMHACGHDVHTTCVLGAAILLNNLKTEFEGTVKFLFQPGEEKLPGGASLMIKEGVLNIPNLKAVIGQHVFPEMEAGKVGFRKGMYMASADELFVTVTGKGGHAAMPHKNIDPIIIASKIRIAIQDWMENRERQDIPTIAAFGKFIANGATNVIPDEVKMEGTFRTMNEEWRAIAHQQMTALSEKIATEMGGTCDFEVRKGYPFLVNNETITGIADATAKAYLGNNNVDELELRMTAEDFSFYTQIAPACFYRLGIANKAKGITSGVHSATFNVDEDCLKIGTGVMANIAIDILK